MHFHICTTLYEAVDANTLRKILQDPVLLISYSVLLLGLSWIRKLLPGKKCSHFLHLRKRVLVPGSLGAFCKEKQGLFCTLVARTTLSQWQSSNIIDVPYVVKGLVSMPWSGPVDPVTALHPVSAKQFGVWHTEITFTKKNWEKKLHAKKLSAPYYSEQPCHSATLRELKARKTQAPFPLGTAL